MIICDYCGAEIPRATLAKRHIPLSRLLRQRHYCNRACDVAHRKEMGLYKQMSLAGRGGRRAFLAQAHPRRKISAETNAKIAATLKRRAIMK